MAAKKQSRRAPVESIEMRPLASLIPYALNPRLHSDEQVAQIAASMKEFGQTQLIVVDEKGEIIVGHGRVLAAQLLKITDLKVGVAIGWSEEQKRAYRIADNQLALTSRWDQDLLRGELKQIEGTDVDLAVLGFDSGFLEGMLLAGSASGGEATAEWAGMPEFTHGDKTAFKSVVMHFKDQAAVDQFEKAIDRKITSSFMWYPEIEIELAFTKQYASVKK